MSLSSATWPHCRVPPPCASGAWMPGCLQAMHLLCPDPFLDLHLLLCDVQCPGPIGSHVLRIFIVFLNWKESPKTTSDLKQRSSHLDPCGTSHPVLSPLIASHHHSPPAQYHRETSWLRGKAAPVLQTLSFFPRKCSQVLIWPVYGPSSQNSSNHPLVLFFLSFSGKIHLSYALHTSQDSWFCSSCPSFLFLCPSCLIVLEFSFLSLPTYSHFLNMYCTLQSKTFPTLSCMHSFMKPTETGSLRVTVTCQSLTSHSQQQMCITNVINSDIFVTLENLPKTDHVLNTVSAYTGKIKAPSLYWPSSKKLEGDPQIPIPNWGLVDSWWLPGERVSFQWWRTFW